MKNWTDHYTQELPVILSRVLAGHLHKKAGEHRKIKLQVVMTSLVCNTVDPLPKVPTSGCLGEVINVPSDNTQFL